MYTIKRLLFLLLLFLTTITNCQNTVGIQTNLAESYNGYTLFSPRTSEVPRYTYLIDNCGRIINTWESQFPLFSTDYLLPDGSLFRSVVDNQSTLNIPGNTGRIEHFSWEGELLWGATISETNLSFHHDYVVLDNGNLLILVAVRRTKDEAIALGRDPQTVATDELYEERIWEIELQGADSYNVIWEWRSWDHIIQDFNSQSSTFGNVAENPQKVDFNYGTSFGEADWWHSNAISYHPERDHIIISNRNLDEFIIIDHSTTTQEAATGSGGNSGKGGDILYRYGNPESYRQGDINSQALNAMHDVQFIEDTGPNAGKILIFNNQPDEGFSEILIIDPLYDEANSNYEYSGGAYGPENPFFSYINPSDFFSAFLSGAQELPNGNILITSGPDGKLFEITTDGSIVWEYLSPVSNLEILQDGDDPDASQTRVFRSLRYSPQYSAFENKDLTPGSPIELNPITDECEILNLQENSTLTQHSSVYPNPALNIINISTDYIFSQAAIFNLSGQKLIESSKKTLNISHLPRGLYFVEITHKNGIIETHKILKN
ncbi:aryl-sulfate sulfotransferase [uncultured Dokdonia sp.]|uniref:aryl-sulfate sulfotransferase n=1 Tax=uncultured Dokdonia sp. TaxID=575653 RepID=UPI00260D5C70|nr:aryl-sulfate sulfotransferase [uncultured Dokdonia sp.]